MKNLSKLMFALIACAIVNGLNAEVEAGAAPEEGWIINGTNQQMKITVLDKSGKKIVDNKSLFTKDMSKTTNKLKINKGFDDIKSIQITPADNKKVTIDSCHHEGMSTSMKLEDNVEYNAFKIVNGYGHNKLTIKCMNHGMKMDEGQAAMPMAKKAAAMRTESHCPACDMQ